MTVRTLLSAVVAVGVLAVPGLASAAPASVAPPIRIPTNAMFGGTVNGRTAHATIRVRCAGPVRPGALGHPRQRQSVGVFIPEVMQSPAFGRTGPVVATIAVSLVANGHPLGAVAAFHRLRLTRPVSSAYAPVPGYLTVPCTGTGTAVFTPVPQGTGAKPAYVDVTFTS